MDLVVTVKDLVHCVFLLEKKMWKFWTLVKTEYFMISFAVSYCPKLLI